MKNNIALAFFIILGFAMIGLLTGCDKKAAVEGDNASAKFTLSDTMMARCAFDVAKMETVKNEIRLYGKISADNDKLAQVYPIVGGSVVKLNTELGDYVKAGQVLAVIRSSEVAEIQREKLNAMTEVAQAERTLKLNQDLFANKINAARDVTMAEKELELAKAELNRVNEVFNIYNLKGEGSLYNIVAPISGFILNKDITQNEVLRSDRGEAIFTIAQIDEVWALANVNESDLPYVKVGYEAVVNTISYPDQSFKGRVDKLFNAFDPETKAMKLLVRVPNPGLLLKPEMNATVNLLFDENRQMVAVPTSAIIFDKNKNWVMVYKDRSNIETRQVEVHSQLAGVAYISSGLNASEKVFSKGGLLVYDALND